MGFDANALKKEKLNISKTDHSNERTSPKTMVGTTNATKNITDMVKSVQEGNTVNIQKAIELIGSLLPKGLREKIKGFFEKLFWSFGKTPDGKQTDNLNFITDKPEEQAILEKYGIKPRNTPYSLKFPESPSVKMTINESRKDPKTREWKPIPTEKDPKNVQGAHGEK